MLLSRFRVRVHAWLSERHLFPPLAPSPIVHPRSNDLVRIHFRPKADLLAARTCGGDLLCDSFRPQCHAISP